MKYRVADDHGPHSLGHKRPASQYATWRGIEYLAARSLLSFLLLIDITLIMVHFWLSSRGQLTCQFNIECDRSVPELFSYVKWFTSSISCAFVFIHKRESLYLVWAMLFAYFLMDDSYSIHENSGLKLETAFDLEPALALRGQDFGELFANLIAGLALLGLMAFLYWRTDHGSDSRKFTQRQLPWLGVLLVCGVVVDMLHIQGSILHFPLLTQFFLVLEDGGEMIAASFLMAISVRQFDEMRGCKGKTMSTTIDSMKKNPELTRLYAGMAVLTLIFQIWVRSSQCAGIQDCGLSFAKAVIWSVIWPASWVVYLAGFL